MQMGLDFFCLQNSVSIQHYRIFNFELVLSLYSDYAYRSQIVSNYPAPGIAPFEPTPATAASCCARLHRRVQTHRHHFYGNVFERSALARSEFCRKQQEVVDAGCP